MTQWQRRNVLETERVKELVEMYESIGFEVRVKDFKPGEFEGECSECMKSEPEKYKVIYTRRLKPD